ncbi:MAG: hypothetical protein HY819_18895 [Acidobacteria bacterium]|nr:hypothetical protein [Acidobacteriota bacterium]
MASCLILNDRFNWFDDSYYIMLAKALANGQGYYDINLPTPQLHKLFPPGLSVFLTIPSWFNFELKTSIIIFKLMLIACGAIGLATFVYLARQEGYREPTITYSVIISATSIAMIGHNVRVASEMLYILLSILALISLNHYEQAPKISRYLFLSAFLIVASLLTRSIGIFLLPAIFISWAIKREFTKIALLFSLVILLLTPWVILTKKTGAGGTSRYLTDMWVQYENTDNSAKSSPGKAIINKLKENTLLIATKEIPRIIFSISASSFVLDNYWANLFSLPIRIFITLLVFVPIFLQLRHRIRISTLYLFFYLGVLLIWPWEPSRFLIPLIPFLILSFFTSLELLTEWLKNKLSLDNAKLLPKAISLVVIFLVISHFTSNIRLIQIVWKSGDYTFEAAKFWQDTQSAYSWVSKNLPKNIVLGCVPALEAYAYLYTERKSIALPTNPIFCKEVSYIIFVDEKLVNNNKDGQSLSDFQNLIKRAGSDSFLKLVYSNDTVKVFIIDQDELKRLLDG